MTADPFSTHEVLNQVPAYGGQNLFTGDPMLARIAAGELAADPEDGLARHGQFWGSAEAMELGRLANVNLPVLKTHDPRGNRQDTIDYHPAYHALMRRSAEAGLASSVWNPAGPDAGHRNLARGIRYFITAQTETGHLCPITMTNASLAALSAQPDLFNAWAPRVLTRKYDHRFLPAHQKAGITLGMGMTEKQGGTDVRTNTSLAERDGDDWRLTGHKWFLSAPMCDAFLTLAQTEAGLTCFLMPRFLPDGSPNGLRLQRLKDKLGNRSNASSEVEFHRAFAQQVGEEGAGIRTIIQMVTLTRLDCALASAGLMRAALSRAVHHARHRIVFQKQLIEQPMMQRVLADMALDVAGATALVMRLADSYDQSASDPRQAAYARLMTPVVKYWVCKIAPALTYEAMECLGGNGYVEENDLPRIFRESPVNAIWEGSGNVMCLDVLRVIASNAATLDDVLEGIGADLGTSGPVSVDVLRAAARACLSDQGSARILTEQLAMTAAAAALRKFAPGLIADAFLDTRLGGQWRATYGMLDGRYDVRGIIDNTVPQT